jgi:hypothetical protein
MNDFSSVGIAALLLALLPFMQTCFRMVRLRCSPANGAAETGSAATPSQRLLPLPRRAVGGLSRFQPDELGQAPHFDLRRIFLPTGSGAYPRDRGPAPGPAAIAAAKRGPTKKSLIA